MQKKHDKLVVKTVMYKPAEPVNIFACMVQIQL